MQMVSGIIFWARHQQEDCDEVAVSPGLCFPCSPNVPKTKMCESSLVIMFIVNMNNNLYNFL
jgi:hypothetical protein